MLPHLARAITVVVLIQTIFLLGIFVEILVTTNGGPGYASTTLTFLIYRAAILNTDVGTAAAGGIVAVVLANIVAIFLMRAIGKNLDSRSETWPAPSTRTRVGYTAAAWAVALLIAFPILWTILTSLKTEPRGDRGHST